MFDSIDIVMRGVVMGLAIAAPVGPIGLLCIRRTLERGVPAGYATGFGAALADTLFGALAAFGITAITDWLIGYQMGLRLLGGLFLLATALWGFTHVPRPPRDRGEDDNLAAALVSGFLLTITNPITILGNIAVVAGFGSGLELADATQLVIGIFLGSALWWGVLSGTVTLARRRMGSRTVQIINRATAVALGLLGVWALGTAAVGLATA